MLHRTLNNLGKAKIAKSPASSMNIKLKVFTNTVYIYSFFLKVSTEILQVTLI